VFNSVYVIRSSDTWTV